MVSASHSAIQHCERVSAEEHSMNGRTKLKTISPCNLRPLGARIKRNQSIFLNTQTTSPKQILASFEQRTSGPASLLRGVFFFFFFYSFFPGGVSFPPCFSSSPPLEPGSLLDFPKSKSGSLHRYCPLTRPLFAARTGGGKNNASSPLKKKT